MPAPMSGKGRIPRSARWRPQAIGVPFDAVELVASDTASSGSAGSASASRLTFMSGNAIRGAAEIALQKWQDEERPAVGEYMYHPPATTPFDPETRARRAELRLRLRGGSGRSGGRY